MEGVFLNLQPKSNPEVENMKWLALGKAVSDEPLNEKEFTNILRNYWNSSRLSSIHAVATNTFTLSFVNEEDLTNAVEECPILVMRHCFIIQPWPIDKPLKSVFCRFVPFWVQIHDLPRELITSENGRKIGQAIGNLIRVEDPIETGSMLKGFIRIRVEWEITKPLLPGFWFPGKGNSKCWAELKFEKLEDFCFSCGRLGHRSRMCKHKADNLNANFGVHMRLPSYKYPVELWVLQQQEDNEMLGPHSDIVEGPQPIEVAQVEPTTRVDNEQVDDTPSMKFTWAIENFSKLNTNKLYSDIFAVDNYKWRILIFPKGNNVDCLSMYLDVADSTSLPYGWSKYAQISLAVVNQIHPKFSIRKESQHQFNITESDWGFKSFMPLTDLFDPTFGYLVNDALVVEAEVTVRNIVD